MVISFLADHPEHIPTVAAWILGEWSHFLPGRTVTDVETGLQAHLNRDKLPLTLLALDGDVLLGTASVQLQDMNTRPDLSPWLAAVYVPPEQRQQGVGSQLVEAAEEAARQAGVERLYLFTPDKQRFYTRLGWSVLDTTEYLTLQVVIMSKFLAGTRR
jgi:GNAT superfamily N-acetyltransferase